ncbi:MAG TPA: Do family serine endopeptidase [Burkholderiales bacterium]|jgi:Do/DeqQ family serine protease|nr:Do family serine endopeptidase [Burkholderiales bacterium]
MARLWLIFSQATTIAVAVLFVVTTFRPEWLPARSPAAPAFNQSAPAMLVSSSRVASYSDAVQRATPSVVNVSTSKEIRSPRHPLLNDPVFRRFFGDQLPEEAQRASSLGSGVIVSTSGYVLTNHHVVEAADEIEVTLADGKKLLAKVVGNDPDTDLAVLRVDAENLPAITFGSSESLRVGDVVLAIGSPFGFSQSVTSGIVSALGRTGLGINTFENFIQTDAAINPGNSGGALTDAAGNLIGINTAIFSPSGGSMGIGFAIPVSTAKMVLEQIVKSGSVTRGWIGVEAQAISPAMADSFKLGGTRGALIAGVLRGGPADKAGVKPGDVLLEVQGKPVADPTGMLNLIAGLAPGQPAKVKLKRHGQDVDATITVGRRPKPQARAE